MRVSKPVAILIGVFTAWPFVYMFVFIAFMIGSFARVTSTTEQEGAFKSFQVLMAAHLGTMLIMMALLTFYIVHVFKNPAIAGDKRTLWAVVLFFGNVIAMPVYWFLYVWREPLRSMVPPPPIPPAPGAVQKQTMPF
jgi:hypothetical protein